MAKRNDTDAVQESQFQRREQEEVETTAELDDALEEQDDDEEGNESHFEGEHGDVELHAPEVEVDEIELDVDHLDAHLSLNVRLAQLLQVRAGLDLAIDDVHLEVRGVETGSYLQVNLDKIQQILNRAFGAIEQNPEVFRETLTGVETSADRGTQNKQLGERLKDAGAAAKEKTKEALGSADSETAQGGSDDTRNAAEADAQEEQ